MKQKNKSFAFCAGSHWACWCAAGSAGLWQRLGAHCRYGPAVRAAGAGLNIVVGYAGLLDLGYVAFFAIGAYMYALLASPHLTETFPPLRPCSRMVCTARSGW
jgi:ABC-type branched-subunit amino acid transport system permease subunit